MAEVSASWYLALSPVLFSIGFIGLLVRRNLLIMFMCVELMLNAVNIAFVAFGVGLDDVSGQGQVAVFFVLVVAATEVVVGLALVVALNRLRTGTTADDVSLLKG